MLRNIHSRFIYDSVRSIPCALKVIVDNGCSSPISFWGFGKGTLEKVTCDRVCVYVADPCI